MSNKRRRPTTEPKDWSGWHPVRIGDLHKLFGRRYRGQFYQFPDDDAGREDLRILLEHYSTSNPIVIPKVVKVRAPWLTGAELDDLLQEVIRHPRHWPARELGIKLNLTEAERSEYDPPIRTIAAADVSDDERKRIRKARKVEQRRNQRRAHGVKSREQYLAGSKSRLKEWEALGCSRRTYYRRLAKSKDGTGLTPVPKQDGTGLTPIIS
jgi:hypothetical protein